MRSVYGLRRVHKNVLVIVSLLFCEFRFIQVRKGTYVVSTRQNFFTPGCLFFLMSVNLSANQTLEVIDVGEWGTRLFGLGRFGLGTFRSDYEILQKSCMFTI